MTADAPCAKCGGLAACWCDQPRDPAGPGAMLTEQELADAMNALGGKNALTVIQAASRIANHDAALRSALAAAKAALEEALHLRVFVDTFTCPDEYAAVEAGIRAALAHLAAPTHGGNDGK